MSCSQCTGQHERITILDAATDTGIGDAAPRGPKPGDYTFCLYCGQGMIFNELGGIDPVPLESMPEDVQQMGRNFQRWVRKRTGARMN